MKLGSVVVLKSDLSRTKMTVNGRIGPDMVECVWFDMSGDLHTNQFDVNALVEVDSRYANESKPASNEGLLLG